MLKEKCIYFNPIQNGYYLVLAADDKMIYGRRGEYLKTTALENWINQDAGLRFKIDDVIINSEFIRNYYLDDKDIEQFELIKELSDDEFCIIDILSNYPHSWPPTLIDMNKPKSELIKAIVENIQKRELEVNKLKTEIHNLVCGLYDLIK